MEVTQTSISPRMVSLTEIKARINRSSTTTVYADIKRGLLPPFVKMGERSVALPEPELAAIQEARAAGADDGIIKALVAKLIQQREQRLAALRQEVAS